MIRTAALALALGSSGAASATFRPLTDHPYRYETDETRTAGGVTRRFHARRSVVFTRTTTGYDAIVTLEAMEQQTGGAIGTLFDAAADALRGYSLRFHIDAAGQVTGVDDADAAIARIVAAIDRIDPARGGHAAPAAALLATTAPARAAMLMSILRPMIAAADAERPSGIRPITLPARAPLPGAARLTGTQTVARPDPATVTIDTQASAAAGGATPETDRASPARSIHVVRRIDAATGLLIESRETDTATLPGPDAMRLTTETGIRITS